MQSVLLASVWIYPIAVEYGTADPIQKGFIAAVTAVMMAGGALVLYPVPLAAFFYSAMIIVGAVSSLAIHGSAFSVHYLVICLTFGSIVAIAITKHTVMFLGELMRTEEAEAQRDVIGMLIGDYEHANSAWLWRCDAGLLMHEVAPGLLSHLGLEDIEYRRMPLRGLLGRAGAQAVDEEDAALLRRLSGPPSELPAQFDMRLRIKAHTTHESVLSIYLRKTISKSGTIIGFEGFARDITEEHHAKEAVEYLASHDIMTGLLNPAAFQAGAAERIYKANEGNPNSEVVFVFIDADNLKSINDTHGHSAGDVLIKTVAERLSAIIGETGLISRKGGDEFLACIFDVNPRDTEDLCAAILASLCRDFEHDGTQLELSCSMGVSRAPAREANLQVLEVEADRALYFAKNKGRSRLEHYNVELGNRLIAERRVANDLPAAIRNQEIRCDFQPVVDVNQNRIIGCEALVRWDHPELGTVLPEDVVNAARYTQCTAQLGALILKRALIAVRQWPSDTYVAVNTMAHELTERNYHQRVLAALDQAGVAPNRLSIEITESELLENSTQVIANLTKLRKEGVKIAVDDFGAGYSSLNYLPQYPNDVIKIDRSLINNSSQSESGPLILNAVATMTKALNVLAIAEGVENEKDLQIVRDAGFNLVQGYYFYKPMRQEELLEVFARSSEHGRDRPDAVNA
ncbi:putative bifunctional diguanylate cyclase/phosphodiesterase [Aliiroseovarius sp. PTFE2010]|uniref:putative bifunctional diguanylate cyclase/phosphodiesterase n=1 Tax=Aliiroseovarius sp. PTFE2010 TaxID=3417190 RepID=UPI003CF5596B